MQLFDPQENFRFSIFDRYVLVEFLKAFLGALILIVVMTNLIDLVENISFYSENKIKFFQIIAHYAAKSPYLIIEMAPVAVLFAVVFSLGIFVKNREMTAIINAGVSFYRVVFYLYVFGFFLSIFLIFFNDIVVVDAQRKVREFDSKYNNNQNYVYNNNIKLYGKNNYLYSIISFNSKLKRMDGIQILKVSPEKDKVISRIDAQYATWQSNENVWKFYNGVVRDFDVEGNVLAVNEFKSNNVKLPEVPDDFEQQTENIDQLTIHEAAIYIEKLKEKGLTYQQETVDFNFKFSFPFSCLIMMLIGAPLSFYSKKSVIVISFGLAFLGSFVFEIIMGVCISMGKNGILPGFLAAWMGNIIFGIISYFVHKKIPS